MRQRTLNYSRALLAGLLFLAPLGMARSDNKIPKPEKEKPPKVEETIRDLAFVRASDNIKVEGVGLVIGLDNTGSNPEPSAWRTDLLDRMRKAQVPSAEVWLESPTTSLVLLQGTIPVGISTKDEFDIEISLTPASTTTSLEGGHLLLTELRVVQVVDGQRLDGQVMAEAFGPVMVGTSQKPDDTKVGRILGGAKVKRDLPYQLILKPERQGYRTVSMLENVINTRFYTRKGIEQKGMAEAKRPEMLVLNVPQVYHHNQYRFFQVVERLPMIDNTGLRAQRQERWKAELLDPKTAGEAALKLEGVGRNAISTLQDALKSENSQVRFFAAESLAYLNDPSGADILAEAASNQTEFRAFALAALAAMDQPASILRLRELLSQSDPKVRYGAFNALRILDEYDPFLGRVRLLRDERPDPDADNNMALQIRSIPRRQERREDPFDLFVVDCEGPPMVHVARTRRCEIVLFGHLQELHPPIVLGGTGPILLNASANDDHIQIMRISAQGASRAEARIESGNNLAEVIRDVANLGATYPEILRILQAADRQRNLEGPLVIDALPDALSTYDKAQLAGVDATAKKDDAVGRAASSTDDKNNTDDTEAPKGGLLQRLRDRIRR